jgi:hypothetical protein
MPKDTMYNSTNKGTLRPSKDVLQTQGGAFKPMKLPHWDWEIILPENACANDPITLFTLYYTLEIINLIVEKTNKY